MTTQGFDRLRPRQPAAEPTAVATPAPADAEGKRALFSSVEHERPAGAGIAIECSRCGETTMLTPAAALRAVFPAFHLSVAFDRGGKESTLGLVRRTYGSWMRCPACGRGAWTRVTIRV
ncbi:MAG: hypothetical protein JO079_07885 [Frankiaceae bacterium]|nr:hypothetical protein [Frankiaceae bacterium]MBV9368598.1 hypothetical protein [Frankiales bacterium]